MMGPPLGKVKASPASFLMKHSKARQVESLRQLLQQTPDALTTTRCKEKIKPDIPKRSGVPVFGVKSDINFVKYNAVINMLSRPPEEKAEKNFLKKKGYGQVPEYLSRVKKQIQSEYGFIASLRDKTKNASEEPHPSLLPEEERLRLLAALKSRWETLNHDYQAMTFKSKMDTIGEARRKEFFEDQLAEVECLIEKLQCNQVWVAAN
ncbi:hypothetical protein Efla_006944 [Eimeria flavescens]